MLDKMAPMKYVNIFKTAFWNCEIAVLKNIKSSHYYGKCQKQIS